MSLFIGVGGGGGVGSFVFWFCLFFKIVFRFLCKRNVGFGVHWRIADFLFLNIWFSVVLILSSREPVKWSRPEVGS